MTRGGAPRSDRRRSQRSQRFGRPGGGGRRRRRRRARRRRRIVGLELAEVLDQPLRFAADPVDGAARRERIERRTHRRVAQLDAGAGVEQRVLVPLRQLERGGGGGHRGGGVVGDQPGMGGEALRVGQGRLQQLDASEQGQRLTGGCRRDGGRVLALAAQQQAGLVVGGQVVGVAGGLDRLRQQRAGGVGVPLGGADAAQHRLGPRVVRRQLEGGIGPRRCLAVAARRQQQIGIGRLAVRLARLIDRPVLVDLDLVLEGVAHRRVGLLLHVLPQFLLEVRFADAERLAHGLCRRHAAGVLLEIGAELPLALRVARSAGSAPAPTIRRRTPRGASPRCRAATCDRRRAAR